MISEGIRSTFLSGAKELSLALILYGGDVADRLENLKDFSHITLARRPGSLWRMSKASGHKKDFFGLYGSKGHKSHFALYDC